MSNASAAPAVAAPVPRPRHFYTEPDWIEVGGLRVAYRRKGRGAATLFLHGAGFTRMWLPFLEPLSQSVDLIAPEHPGYGETEMPEWLDGFDDLVIHYDELLDALELESVHLVGYSLGGWIAAEFAVFYPGRLESLTLITPAGFASPGKPIGRHLRDGSRAVLLTFFNDPTNIAQILPDFESLDEIVHQFGEAATLARLAWNPQYDPKLDRRLERVTVPALVVSAENDRLIPDEMAERYAELLAERAHRDHPRAPATRCVEQPEKTADAVIGVHRGGGQAR